MRGGIIYLAFLFLFFCFPFVNSASSSPVNVSINLVPGVPLIDLISPTNGFSTTDTTIDFEYNVTHSLNVSNCSFILNGAINETFFNITLGVTNNLSRILSVGSYSWQVNCTDNSSNTGNSSLYSFSITTPSSGGGGGSSGGSSSCTPDCLGKSCGGDGCGGSCGTCLIGENCESNQCVEVCSNQCSPGEFENECVADDLSRVRSCELNGACYEWSEWSLTSCDSGESCQAGICSQCVESWACGDWSVCTGGIQTRICTDVNSCGTTIVKPNETQSCITGVNIDFFPLDSDLILALGETVDFDVDVEDLAGAASIEVKWYLDGILDSQDSGLANLNSFFGETFSVSSKIRAEIAVDGVIQNVYWDVSINEEANLSCEPNWNCNFNDCLQGDSYSYPYECVDLNECGVSSGKPERRECDCYSEFECGDWGECSARYYIDDAIEGSSFVQGFIERTCRDVLECASSRVERESCELTIPVVAKVEEFCGEDVVEISDPETDEVLSRVKKDPILEFSELDRLDISLATTSFTGYCSYCSNGIQDEDEEGVDCGGSCADCFEFVEFFDWLSWFGILLWILTSLSLVSLVYVQRGSIYSALSNLISSARIGGTSESILEERVSNFLRGQKEIDALGKLTRDKVKKPEQPRKGGKLSKKTSMKELKEKFLKEGLSKRKPVK